MYLHTSGCCFSAAASKTIFIACALQYEKHEVKVDPAHGGRHRIEEEVATATALGGGGYAMYEHHEIKQDHKAEGQYREEVVHKKHGWF